MSNIAGFPYGRLLLEEVLGVATTGAGSGRPVETIWGASLAAGALGMVPVTIADCLVSGGCWVRSVGIVFLGS
jgi:hypothetical protein